MLTVFWRADARFVNRGYSPAALRNAALTRILPAAAFDLEVLDHVRVEHDGDAALG